MELRTEFLKFIMPAVLLFIQIVAFARFEKSRPKARDLVVIAVMSVIGALGRVLFAAVPSFKPTSAIVMIAGIQFGPQAGFLSGALSALASNLFLGQGPWTLWQMTAWGMIGLLSAIFQKKGWFQYRIVLYGFGMISGIAFGWFMNLQYLLGYVNPLTWKAVLASCISSIGFDVVHGISTVIFLLLLERSWGKKLARLKKKYGIMEKGGAPACM